MMLQKKSIKSLGRFAINTCYMIFFFQLWNDRPGQGLQFIRETKQKKTIILLAM